MSVHIFFYICGGFSAESGYSCRIRIKGQRTASGTRTVRTNPERPVLDHNVISADRTFRPLQQCPTIAVVRASPARETTALL